ncbi:MAG TPA: DoxX family membrane protein [Tepidisphaeraceae bacterium]|nr:DoxX family membrane protein [Tepidisphaeraceae bacterium]
MLRPLTRLLLSTLFLSSGLLHLLHPAPFQQIVPPYLPNPSLLVLLSGLAEITGAIGLLLPPLRRPAAIGLIALLIAVFPANIQMALHPNQSSFHLPLWLLYARLPLQFLLIAAVWWSAQLSRS